MVVIFALSVLLLLAALWLQRQLLLRRALHLGHYRKRCLAYERCLGLPFWNRSETDQAIWARAAAGDEEAWEILSSLHGDEAPLRLDDR